MAVALADPTTLWAEEVTAGRHITGRLVRLACQRHLDDVQHGKERGLVWDERAAQDGLDFFGFLRLHEGEFDGQPFELHPSQRFILGSLLGWLGDDGYRRFRNAYVEEGKGNGKTPMFAGLGGYGLTADGEAGAEVYTAGVTRDQAHYLWDDFRKMVEKSPALRSRVQVNAHHLSFPATGSYMRPVSSEGRSLDQKRVHMALIDEIHEHASSVVVDKMRAGTKGRRNALIGMITNSGYDRTSVCWQLHDYSIKVLEGIIPNDAWFAFVCGLDPCAACWSEGHRQPNPECGKCDDWTDEAVWPKANPLLGMTITHRYLREQVTEAIGMPARANIVKRLNFCIWTEGAERWLDMGAWDECNAQPAQTSGGYLGLDLSHTTDLSAAVHIVPSEGYLNVWAKFWMPADNLHQRVEKDRVPFDLWAEQGWITLTPGNTIDYDRIRADVNAWEGHDWWEIGMDPYNAKQLRDQLVSDGHRVFEVRQGFLTLSGPSKELERRVKGRQLRHGGNPVLRWMASNAIAAMDAAGNIKPDKEHSTERIDGISAFVCALARLIERGTRDVTPKRPSVRFH